MESAAIATALSTALSTALRSEERRERPSFPQPPRPAFDGPSFACSDPQVLWAERGSAPQTTNNRMELSAIIAALRRLGEDEAAVIYSDSKLCVQTLTVRSTRRAPQSPRLLRS